VDLRKFSDAVTLTLSVVLHPLLMPLYLYFFMTSRWYPFSVFAVQSWWVLPLILLILTFCIPLIMVAMLKTMGLITSLHLENRSERTVPFLVTAIAHYFASRMVQRFGVPSEYTLMLLGSSGMILLAMAINFRWKISIHMMGIGGVAGILLGLSRYAPAHFFYPVMVVFVLSGLVGVSRIGTGSHRPAEVYAGFLVGFTWFLVLFTAIP